jgi:hypothetical protein
MFYISIVSHREPFKAALEPTERGIFERENENPSILELVKILSAVAIYV